MEVKNLQREYFYKDKNIYLSDIPGTTPSQAMKIYAGTYAELVNAKVVGPFIKNDKQIYEFHNVTGTNG